MSTRNRIIALFFAIVTCFGLVVTSLTGCDRGNTNDTESTTTQGNGDGTTKAPDSPVNPNTSSYTVSVKSLGGLALAGVNFYVYKGQDELVTFGVTDEKGIGKVDLVPANDYTIEISSSDLKGYAIEKRYSFTGKSANIVLTSSVITDDTSLSGITYKLGDVVRDFSFVDSDGNTRKLSETLKEKKAVMLNFWYTGCSWCVEEFPVMNSAYNKYKDQIEIFALNHYQGDDETAVKLFKSDMALDFVFGKDYTGLQSALGIGAYPTSVIIDRYGVICLIEAGAILSEKTFTTAFDHLIAENYEQKLFANAGELAPVEKPTVENPTSETIASAFNGNGMNATFHFDEDEYAWPFVADKLNGENVIKPSNSYKDGSYAIIYAKVQLKAGDVLAFDWLADTELGEDVLFVLVNKKDIYQISGVGESFATCYAFVADADGEYELALCYQKSDGTDVGKDTVYLKNLRTVKESDINSPTYIPRYCATNPNASGLGYKNYATVVFNENDGYYHVGKKDGPLLLANLMGATLFSETSVNLMGYNGQLIDGERNLYETLEKYCNYSINSELYGYCTVNAELAEILKTAARLVGLEVNNENAWLQMCSYYDAYGTNGVQLDDPIKGLATFSAFETIESKDGNKVYNEVSYNRLIMPRGYKYLFIPEKSGAYSIVSQSTSRVEGWIFLENGTEYYIFTTGDRLYTDANNVSMTAYLEAGVKYYIDIAYANVSETGTFTFTVEYLAPSVELFMPAAPGYFTYIESTGGSVNEILGLGIDVVLGDDGYYHEKRDDGSVGSIIYADFSSPTSVFSHSIKEMIKLDAFNFGLTESDHFIMNYMKMYGSECEAKLKEIWGEFFNEYAELHKLYDVLEGKYHGKGPDLTAEIQTYVAKMEAKTDAAPELEGCVKVDARLAELLQMLMDKYTFADVENSFLKVCYYYEYIGA